MSERAGGPVMENHPDLWRSHLRTPALNGHKYDRGHCMVLSGGPASTGAARLAARAALRSGAGLVTVLSPPSALLINACHLTAVMVARARDDSEIALHLADDRVRSVVVGPGFGTSAQRRVTVLTVLASGKKVVLDADALTVFSGEIEELTQALDSDNPPVLTPHTGEFSRLFPQLDGQDENNQAKAVRAAKLCGAIIVLKGAETVIASPRGEITVNRHASPWLATAGSGDVLAGIIGGLLAQGMPPYEAACASVWLHGDAAIQCGPALIAEDLDQGLKRALGGLMTSTKR